MNIELDVTLQCNFSCVNCNRYSNFNKLVDPTDKNNTVGLNFYGNTDVTINHIENFVNEVKQYGGVNRLHIIGGEPLVHPQIGKITSIINKEVYGTHIPNVLIISNLHPTMIKSGMLDSPQQILENFKFGENFSKLNLENIPSFTRMTLEFIQEYISTGKSKEDIINELETFQVELENGERIFLNSLLSNSKLFHGIPVINYKPLDKKADEHRCSLVAPYDSGQEMIPSCNVPKHCGINLSFDGYWPCSQGAAIARLFKLDKYKKSRLPKSLADWDGIDAEGNAQINKSSSMWDLCKLCQTSAKTQMYEKDHGRPISISYRKALGLEKSDSVLSDYVVPSHSKKLAPLPTER